MPRQARIDIEGCLYHVIARGIERHKIFSEEADCADFLKRLKASLESTGGKCLAWCLIPNHFHLLILRGRRPLAEVMRRLMTGYAVGFNLRYKCSGHLFQNRCKAILIARGRALYCYLRKTAGGVNGAVLMKELKISSGAASYLAHKGRELAKAEHLSNVPHSPPGPY